MFCFPDLTHNRYVCSTVNRNHMHASVIRLTPSPAPSPTYTPPPIITSYSITNEQFIYAYLSLYLLFPSLYIIVSSTQFMLLWQYIISLMKSTMKTTNEYMNELYYTVLRIFGYYSFSTYTVVQNGREIYKASSLFYYFPSNKQNVYYIDRAKYNVCKWIDAQCELYRRQYNGEEPELTQTHNDIYDFILHKVDDQPYTRIHRGDFTGKTHTLITKNYRPFCKSRQFMDKTLITIHMPNTNDNCESVKPTPETFIINLKYPNNFFLEKNEILDKKFLQWKLYNEYGRKDVATYIGMPFSNYKVTMFYSDCMKEFFSNKTDTEYPAYYITDGNSILIGKRYTVKVDNILRCPVFDSNEKQVFDIDGILSNYYDCSDSESDKDGDTDGDKDCDKDSESTAITDIEELLSDSEEPKCETKDEDGETKDEDGETKDEDVEFEMIEQ